MKRFKLDYGFICTILDTKENKIVAVWRKDYVERTGTWEFTQDVLSMSENLVKLLNDLDEGK